MNLERIKHWTAIEFESFSMRGSYLEGWRISCWEKDNNLVCCLGYNRITCRWESEVGLRSPTSGKYLDLKVVRLKEIDFLIPLRKR